MAVIQTRPIVCSPANAQCEAPGQGRRTEKPASLPYRANMTVLDAMIAVGGLGEFASGNRAKLVRFDKQLGKQREYGVRLNDLLKKGDTTANVMLQPGDVIIIPESMF